MYVIIAHMISGDAQTNQQINRHGKHKVVLRPASRTLHAQLAGKNIQSTRHADNTPVNHSMSCVSSPHSQQVASSYPHNIFVYTAYATPPYIAHMILDTITAHSSASMH